jgi:ATP-binding cassette subfamily B protein
VGQEPRRNWLEIYPVQEDVLTRSRGELACVLQVADNDCGLAAVATVAAHYGRKSNYLDLVDGVLLDPDGTDLFTLSHLAQQFDLETRGVFGDYDQIGGCRLPAIAHFRKFRGFGHFAVLHRWTPAHVILADPARGIRKRSRRSFCRSWTGYLLLLQPST